MSPQITADENENVFIVVQSNKGQQNVNQSTHLQSPDHLSLNISSDNSNLSDYEDDRTCSTYTKERAPNSSTQLTDLWPKTNPLKARFYRAVRGCLWIFPLFVVILVPSVCLIP